jgi:hypothetical protein
VDISDAKDLWSPEPGWLNTATYGLPPRPAWDQLQCDDCGADDGEQRDDLAKQHLSQRVRGYHDKATTDPDIQPLAGFPAQLREQSTVSDPAADVKPAHSINSGAGSSLREFRKRQWRTDCHRTRPMCGGTSAGLGRRIGGTTSGCSSSLMTATTQPV